MKALLLSVCTVLLIGCEKADKPAAPKEKEKAPTALESAAADFKARVATLQAAKIENAVFTEIRHDITRTNSITSPLKAQVSAKQIVTLDGMPAVYALTIHAQYREGHWHYDKCVGKIITDGKEIEVREDSFNVESAYDLVKTLRLKHDDIHHEQFK